MCRSVSLRGALALLLSFAGAAAGAELGDLPQRWHQGSAGVAIPPWPSAEFGYTLASGDYNCDGLDDVAFGIPGDNLPGAARAGRVLVLFAQPDSTGLGTLGRQFLSQAEPGAGSPAIQAERFGAALAAGDFDRDGCGDLAIGTPFDFVEGVASAGSVQVYYGSAGTGLASTPADYFSQAMPGVGDVVEASDRFGFELAVGDFNADGFDDLAIGVPIEFVSADGGDVAAAGMVHVLFGSNDGVTTAGARLISRGQGLSGTPRLVEMLGMKLAAGDIDPAHDGDELILGIPNHYETEINFLGAVLVLADVDGVIQESFITQDSPGVPDTSESGDEFGSSLAVGDFDGDGRSELAVGSRGETVGDPAVAGAGSVSILYTDGDPMQVFSQDDLPPDEPEFQDFFGHSIVAADFTGDGIDDLAIGVQFEDGQAGRVHVLPGSAGVGLGVVGQRTYSNIDPGAGERFGQVLAAGRLRSPLAHDLVVAAPWDRFDTVATGSATVLYSTVERLFVDGFEPEER